MLMSPIFYLSGCLQLSRVGGGVDMSNPALLLGVEADAWGVGVTCPRPPRSSATSPVPSLPSHSFITPSCGPPACGAHFLMVLATLAYLSTCLPEGREQDYFSRIPRYSAKGLPPLWMLR